MGQQLGCEYFDVNLNSLFNTNKNSTDFELSCAMASWKNTCLFFSVSASLSTHETRSKGQCARIEFII